MTARQPMSRRSVRWALIGAGGLVVLGLAALWLATRAATAPVSDDAIAVTITDRACEPAALTVPAGQRTFVIHNASNRTLEWEILDGVMVVAERENIVPGLDTTLSPRLKAGTYAITCGLLSNPRGTLTVTATAESEAAKARPETREFIGPLSEYRVYLSRRAAQLVDATTALQDKIAAGDVAAAKEAWLQARVPWQQMAPIWPYISDLTERMDPLADYLSDREQDAAFTGFHRIEYGLWNGNSTDGLLPFAEALAKDAAALKDRVRELQVAPDELAGNAATLANRSVDHARGGAVSYSGSDLAEYGAALDGLAKSALLVDPLVIDAAPDVSADLHKALDDARSTISGLQSLDDAGRKAIGDAFQAVTTAVSAINPAIGLE